MSRPDDEYIWGISDSPGESGELWNSGELDKTSVTPDGGPTEWLGEMTPEDSARLERPPVDPYAETEPMEIVKTLSAHIEYQRGDSVITRSVLLGLLLFTMSCFVQVLRADSLTPPKETQPVAEILAERVKSAKKSSDSAKTMTNAEVKASTKGPRTRARIERATAFGRSGERIKIEVVLANPTGQLSKPVNLEIRLEADGIPGQSIFLKSNELPPGNTTPLVVETPFVTKNPISLVRHKFKTREGPVVNFKVRHRNKP